METLGTFIKEKREFLLKNDRSFSQLQIAKRIGIEQSYLSKIERGVATKLSEEKIISLAQILNEDPDYMLALGGKVSEDVLNIIQERPRIFARLVRQMKDMPKDLIEADHEFKQTQVRISHLYDLALLGFFHFADTQTHSSWSKLTPSLLCLSHDISPSMANLKAALSPESEEMFSKLEKKAFQSRQPYECELRIKSEDKKPRYIAIWGDSEILPDGSTVRLGLIQDITQQVLSREEIKQAHQALSGTVEEQTEQLDKGIKKLKKEISTRKILEAELREINVEIAQQKEIQREYLKENAYELRSLINRLATESTNLNESPSGVLNDISMIINNMNDFFEIEAGVSPQLDSLESVTFLENTISDIQGRHQSSTERLRFDLSPDLPTSIRVDSLRMQQILHSISTFIMQNTLWGCASIAIDYSSDDNSIFMHFSSPKIKESVTKESFYPTIRNARQSPRTWNLITVGPIVEGLGGQLFVDQTTNNGLNITVILPIEISEIEQSCTTRSLPFLIVEDDKYSRLYSERIIQKLGYEVESVATGKEALNKIHKNKYSTIILDIQLPDINGITIAEATRELECPNHSSRIIAVTAHATPEDRNNYEKAGIDNFIAKPFKLETLAQIIKTK
ncbi:response regulator [Maridesulfovibrio sp.]|uniref:response regulator n=1 Tax=unclassified Maridesulfovibrio TaxID=2794999 RepID=UPI003B00E135